MKLIVGLGNPGSEYATTRHNCGFLTLDVLAEQLNCQFVEKGRAWEARTTYQGEKIILLKPQTFMNLSGYAVVAALNFYKIDQEELLVIFDDMDLPPGRLRLRRGGTAGGHNGIKSIIEQLGNDQINRLKIGIGRSPFPNSADYVLSRFTEDEAPVMAQAFVVAADAALCWAKDGIGVAMNQYNKVKIENSES